MSTETKNPLAQSLTLPCGAEIKNRLFKSAMSEIMGTKDHGPSEELSHLYSRWAEGGTGLLVTGNVMVDRNALGEPRNVVMDNEGDIDALSRWAESGKKNNTHIWVQLNHPGRQSPSFLSPKPVAPSSIPYDSALKHAFNTPRELTDDEIWNIVKKFAFSASIAKNAGFTGVQVHAAHGYLVSQFLSPMYNKREDQWGGSIENRMRFLIEIVKAIRNEVGSKFPVGVKMNSSDFKTDGLTEIEALKVIEVLADEGVDLIEISGGTYESPVMMGGGKKKKTRTPFFIDFAEKAVPGTKTPIVLTGGFRTESAMSEAVSEVGVAMVGLARPLVVDPELPLKVLSGETYQSQVKPLTTGIKLLDRIAMLEITWYENQMRYMGNGEDPRPGENVYRTVYRIFKHMGSTAFKRRRA
ncbi:NADH:flavin oxidoreductase/NADH oxidase family protein [Desulfobacterales bacterium HSG16]|nr:NADH:flavin oxidoreductase/NADH oxidase family protein [Desulfobacterales bacterium HSG16]